MLESGALSDAKFPDWSKSVVLFCHITSQVQGEKYPKLLSEKGGRGFPYLVLLDAEGAVIARHKGERNVEQFEATAGRARAFLDLRAKAASGDKAAKAGYELAKIELEIDTVKLDDAKQRIAALGDLDADTKKKADALLADVEASEIVAASAGGGRATAAKRAHEMRKAGRIPSDGIIMTYWYLVLEGAEAASDAAIYEEALKVVKQRTFQRYDDTLRKLKEKSGQ